MGPGTERGAGDLPRAAAVGVGSGTTAGASSGEMHCIFEGLVHHHSRRVLRIDTKLAKRKETMGAAFEQDWLEYTPEQCHPSARLKNEARELPMIRTIQTKLVQPLLEEDDDDESDAELDEDELMPDAPDPKFVPAVTEAQMHNNLMKNNLQPLRWVIFSLGLDMTPERIASKKLCCDQLLTWVSKGVLSIITC